MTLNWLVMFHQVINDSFIAVQSQRWRQRLEFLQRDKNISNCTLLLLTFRLAMNADDFISLADNIGKQTLASCESTHITTHIFRSSSINSLFVQSHNRQIGRWCSFYSTSQRNKVFSCLVKLRAVYTIFLANIFRLHTFHLRWCFRFFMCQITYSMMSFRISFL